jgi:hypothetical protein
MHESACRTGCVADPDPHRFGKPDPDQHQIQKQNTNQDTHQRQNSGAVQAYKAIDAHNRGVENQNGAAQGM